MEEENTGKKSDIRLFTEMLQELKFSNQEIIDILEDLKASLGNKQDQKTYTTLEAAVAIEADKTLIFTSPNNRTLYWSDSKNEVMYRSQTDPVGFPLKYLVRRLMYSLQWEKAPQTKYPYDSDEALEMYNRGFNLVNKGGVEIDKYHYCHKYDPKWRITGKREIAFQEALEATLRFSTSYVSVDDVFRVCLSNAKFNTGHTARLELNHCAKKIDTIPKEALCVNYIIEGEIK